MRVNTANLNEFSNSILFSDNKTVNEKRDITNIKTVKKYLLISAVSKLILEKIFAEIPPEKAADIVVHISN